MVDFFVYRDHLCIVFELLSISLYDLIKENKFEGVSLNFARLIISNILEGMKIFKEARIIHCDLKYAFQKINKGVHRVYLTL